jgi:prepilin-type N-terminal cleavage/methylation domain-containing protein
MNNSLTKQYHNGFTLLEMLFAVIIFSFALVSLMLIAGKGVIATSTAKDQLIAQYLAEEGAEVARNMRDTNFINQDEWLFELDTCTQNTPCDVDYTDIPKLVEIDGQTSRLYENVGGYYKPIAGGIGESKFSRAIYLEDIGTNNYEKAIVVDITWKQRSLDRKFTFRTYISNWQTPSGTTP